MMKAATSSEVAAFIASEGDWERIEVEKAADGYRSTGSLF
jgi:hypothetical protein